MTTCGVRVKLRVCLKHSGVSMLTPRKSRKMARIINNGSSIGENCLQSRHLSLLKTEMMTNKATLILMQTTAKNKPSQLASFDNLGASCSAITFSSSIVKHLSWYRIQNDHRSIDASGSYYTMYVLGRACLRIDIGSTQTCGHVFKAFLVNLIKHVISLSTYFNLKFSRLFSWQRRIKI